MHARGSACRFWEARFARLWPAYAFSLLCSSLPGMFLPSVPVALATLAMVQAWNPWRPELAGSWNFVCWTLSVEAFFYLIFPFAQRSLERLRTPALGFAGLLVLSVGIFCNVAARTLGDAQYPPPWNRIPLPVIQLPVFLVGVVLGNLLPLLKPRDEELQRHQHRPVFTTLGALSSLVALATLHGALTSLVLIPFAMLITGLAFERSQFASLLARPAMLLGGTISYSIYLLQTPVRLVVHSIAALQVGLAGLVFVPLVLVPLAYLVYRFLEEPSRLALRRLFAAAHRARDPS